MGKQYHLSFKVKAVGKNIKWGIGEGYGDFGEGNQESKIEVGKNIKL